MESGITLLCAHYWGLAAVLGNFYTGFAQDTRLTAAEISGVPGDESRDVRQVALSAPGIALGQILAAYCRPLTFVMPFPLYILRKLGLVLCIGVIFASGFRSVLFAVILGFLVSSYFQRGWSDVLRLASVGVCALGLLGLIQGTIIDLPLPAQRALSFLPGHWDSSARQDAADSTQWRVEMWKDAIFTDKYIDNKLFGDGFGVSASQMHRVMMLQALPGLTREQGQANAAVVSNFHSGPVSAIKFVGYVGLILYLALLTQTAKLSVRLIRRALHTPFQALALYICIPAFIGPIFYVFIYGNYGEDLPTTIFAIGMMRMLGNSLDNWEVSESSKEQVSPMVRRISRPMRPALLPEGVVGRFFNADTSNRAAITVSAA